MLDRIIRADCISGMAGIPGGSVDMVLTDLPYGCTDCAWDVPLDQEALWTQLERVTSDHAAMVFFANMRHAVELINTRPKLFRYDLVWQKTAPVGFANARRMPLRSHELILVFYKHLPPYHPQGLMRVDRAEVRTKPKPSGVYKAMGKGRTYTVTATNYPRSVQTFAHDAHRIHPTQKPVSLMEWLVRTYTDPGAVVLDPCIGSGTTAVACVRTGRHYIGFETCADYADEAEKRIQLARESLTG